MKRVNDGMLEEVAFAIGRAQGFTSKTVMRKKFRAAAEAALRAMREPTEAMTEAALSADLDIYWSYRADGAPGGPEDVWRTMIDAALAGG